MSCEPTYEIVEGEVVVADAATGDNLWVGRPLGRNAVDLIELPDKYGAAVLLDDWDMPPELGPNLVAINSLGQVLWQAPPPTQEHGDVYVPDLRMTDEGISVGSWSGYDVIVSPKDGRILNRTFTK